MKPVALAAALCLLFQFNVIRDSVPGVNGYCDFEFQKLQGQDLANRTSLLKAVATEIREKRFG
jgi:hypothetical protein